MSFFKKKKNLDDNNKKTHSFSFSLFISKTKLHDQKGTIVGLRHDQEPGLKGGGSGKGNSRNSSGGSGIPRPDDDVLEDLARSMRKAADAAMKGSSSAFGR